LSLIRQSSLAEAKRGRFTKVSDSLYALLYSTEYLRVLNIFPTKLLNDHGTLDGFYNLVRIIQYGHQVHIFRRDQFAFQKIASHPIP